MEKTETLCLHLDPKESFVKSTLPGRVKMGTRNPTTLTISFSSCTHWQQNSLPGTNGRPRTALGESADVGGVAPEAAQDVESLETPDAAPAERPTDAVGDVGRGRGVPLGTGGDL